MGRDSKGVDWIPRHVWRGLDEDKIVYSSVPVVSLAVLIRQYQFLLDTIDASNMVQRGVPQYGLYLVLVCVRL